MWRRFFQGFKQCIKTMPGQHVYFINQVDFKTAAGRGILNIIQQFPGILNTGSGGRIHFNQIHKTALINFQAGSTFPTGFCRDPLFTVQGFGQYSGDGCFTHSAGTSKQVSMVQTFCFQRISQSLKHMLLPHHGGECFWTVFTRQNLVFHRSL